MYIGRVCLIFSRDPFPADGENVSCQEIAMSKSAAKCFQKNFSTNEVYQRKSNLQELFLGKGQVNQFTERSD